MSEFQAEHERCFHTGLHRQRGWGAEAEKGQVINRGSLPEKATPGALCMQEQ